MLVKSVSVISVICAMVGAGLVGEAAITASTTQRPVLACTDLIGDYDIVGAYTHVTSAEPVDAGSQAYCKVEGFVESDVRFELRLPTETYNGRYVQYGCDGLCGFFESPQFPECGGPIGEDFAVAATDDGHQGQLPPGTPPELEFLKITDGTWAANNQRARNDYFFRAPHVVSMASRRIIAAYYGHPPMTSYFVGCSTGGREGLLLAQRYPDDFDGIVAGAPTHVMGPLMGIYMAWLVRANSDPNGEPILTHDKLPALHHAALTACDDIDGLADGQIDEPRACRFDPVAIECPLGVDRSSCLTPAQVGAARRLYDGPRASSGRRLYPGWASPGSELAWEGSSVPTKDGGFSIAPLPDNYLRYVGYPIGAPHSSLSDIRFTVRELHRLTAEGRKGNSMTLDLREFRRAGGKLILWHGQDDQSLPSVGTADYYQRLWQYNGGLRRTQRWARLFMVPTLYHCRLGGYRLTQFDPFPALVAWVERGRAPGRIIATGTSPDDDPRSRPVYPYPLRARYIGSGSVDSAHNFQPAPPRLPPQTIDWAGAYLHHVPGPRTATPQRLETDNQELPPPPTTNRK